MSSPSVPNTPPSIACTCAFQAWILHQMQCCMDADHERAQLTRLRRKHQSMSSRCRRCSRSRSPTRRAAAASAARRPCPRSTPRYGPRTPVGPAQSPMRIHGSQLRLAHSCHLHNPADLMAVLAPLLSLSLSSHPHRTQRSCCLVQSKLAPVSLRTARRSYLLAIFEGR